MSLSNVLILAAGIFSIGVYGILSRQNLIVLLMCVELILNGANLALAAFGRALAERAGSGAAGQAHAFIVIVLAVAAAEAAVGLAILLAVYRKWRSANAGDIASLSG